MSLSDAFAAALEKAGLPVRTDIKDAEEAAAAAGRALHALDLPGNVPARWRARWGDGEATALATALTESNSQLSRLCLDYNEITDDGLEALSAVVPSRVEHFSLSHNEVEPAGVEHFARALSAAGADARLQSLCLRGNRVGDAGAMALAESIRAHCPLTHLDLRDCDISTKGIVALCGALRETDNTLGSLWLDNLRATGSGDESLVHIARVAAASSTLQSLSLARHPSCSDAAATTLVEALHDNHNSLEHLSLASTRVGGDTARALARLATRPSLRRIDLHACPITSEGAHAWADQFERGGLSLDWLDLRFALVEDDGLAALLSALDDALDRAGEVTHPVAKLWLWGNQWGEEARVRLGRMAHAGRIRTLDRAESTADGDVARRAGFIWCDCKPYTVDGAVQIAHVPMRREDG